MLAAHSADGCMHVASLSGTDLITFQLGYSARLLSALLLSLVCLTDGCSGLDAAVFGCTRDRLLLSPGLHRAPLRLTCSVRPPPHARACCLILLWLNTPFALTCFADPIPERTARLLWPRRCRVWLHLLRPQRSLICESGARLCLLRTLLIAARRRRPRWHSHSYEAINQSIAARFSTMSARSAAAFGWG